MTAHVRKGFVNALNSRGITTADDYPQEYEDYFRAGVRFEQGRERAKSKKENHRG